MDKKEEIKRHVSMLDVAGLYLDLKPAGKYYKSICPFHNEKTPSFFVNPEKNTFNCYGCHEYGDIFTMVEKMENLGFLQAMDFIVKRFNLKIESSSASPSPRNDLREIQRLACRFFRQNLAGKADGDVAAAYLARRKINSDSTERFQIGYAPKGWDGMRKYLQKKGISAELGKKAGLLLSKEGRYFDRFRGRLMFPVLSETGVIIGFGGRTLFDDRIKYMNSPQTPLFQKGRNFFGLNHAKAAIRESKAAIVVEGYFDMISLFQRGIRNVVAPLGTALTEDQIYIIKRFAQRLFLLFDNDNAGLDAMKRAIGTAIPHGTVPYVITLPDGKDPDEFILRRGVKDFRKYLGEAREGMTFIMDQTRKSLDFNVPPQKIQAVRETLSIIDQIEDPIIRNHYRQMAADYYQITVKDLSRYSARSPASRRRKKAVPAEELPCAERLFITSLIALNEHKPGLIREIRDQFNPDLFRVIRGSHILRALFSAFSEEEGRLADPAAIRDRLSDAEKPLVAGMFMAAQELEPGDIHTTLRSSLENFRERYARFQMKELTQKIGAAYARRDLDEVRELMGLKNQIKGKFFRRNG